MQSLAERDNLPLNCSKSSEVVFRDNKRLPATAGPAPMLGIARSSSLSLNMLGMNIGDDFDDFSVTQHVERMNGLHPAGVADTPPGQHSGAARIPWHCHRPSHVRRQRVARTRQNFGPPAHRPRDGSSAAPRVLHAGTADV
jgi:hypothetical protein